MTWLLNLLSRVAPYTRTRDHDLRIVASRMGVALGSK